MFISLRSYRWTFLSLYPPQMVLKINGIFEARRGKKRMKRVSQSTESSSGRGEAPWRPLKRLLALHQICFWHEKRSWFSNFKKAILLFSPLYILLKIFMAHHETAFFNATITESNSLLTADTTLCLSRKILVRPCLIICVFVCMYGYGLHFGVSWVGVVLALSGCGDYHFAISSNSAFRFTLLSLEFSDRWEQRVRKWHGGETKRWDQEMDTSHIQKLHRGCLEIWL